MRRRSTAALLVAISLVLAGCSSGGDDSKPQPTVTVTKSPELSATEKRQACVDAWLVVFKETPNDAPDIEDKPTECEGLSGQADMYVEAMQQRNAENRGKVDECLEDPSCTSIPIP
jgi:PBP1b-binding outer membrane lipoprotein LpoB